MLTMIQDEIKKLSALLMHIYNDSDLLSTVDQIGETCIQALKRGNKILFVGNGGSAADAQHLAAEIVCRLRFNRPGVPAMALTTDTSVLTAIGNDWGFEYIFARQVEAMGSPGDVLIAISTSGKSANVLQAVQAAVKKEMIVIGFSGKESPRLKEYCRFVLNIPSNDTQKIQECHIMFGHILCGLIENELFAKDYCLENTQVTEVA